MYVVLFLVGMVLAFAGAVLIYTVPVPVVDAGAAALFGSGALAMVGGLVLMGLAAVVRVLNRIAERLEIQPLPVPPIAAVGREDPAPRPARPQQPVAAAAPAPAARPSLLGWFGRGGAPVPATAARATVQRATPAPEVVESPAVDLAPLTRVEEPRAPAPVPPPAPAPVAAPAPPPPPKPVIPKPAARPAAPAPANGTPETTVYKSGVIDGMAYTLFMDGAIEAELPQGRVKFGSIDELQRYLTSGQ
jgi:hypothetical protein